jgi:hypothetical protein
VHLTRLQTGRTIAQTSLGERTFRLVESKHKSQITARSLVVSGGSHTPRVDATSYRSAESKVFDIDPIVVRQETASDRIGKKLGLNLEAQLGDASIDARYYFETDTRPDVVVELFSDPALRFALLSALAKFDAVVVAPPGGTVAGVMTRSPSRFTLSDAGRLQRLEELAAALPAIRSRPPKAVLARVAPQVIAMVTLQACIMAGVFLTTGSRYLAGPMMLAPVGIGVVVAVLLAFTVLLFAFRRRANGFAPWLATSFVSLIAMPFLSVGLVNRLNVALDEARPTRHEVTVLAYKPHINKKQTGLLRVLGLPATVMELDPGGAVEIEHRWMPDRSCKRVALDIAPGYFGNPWVSEVACVSVR